jgi:hypothetical protein
MMHEALERAQYCKPGHRAFLDGKMTDYESISINIFIHSFRAEYTLAVDG